MAGGGGRAYLHIRSIGYVAYLLGQELVEELHRWRLVRTP